MTLKDRFLNDTLTDEDYCKITILIDRDELMKPVNENTVIKSFGRCPACKGIINNHMDFNNCGRCGQRLDWKVEE